MTTERLQKLHDFLKDSPNDAFLLFAIAKEHEKLGDDAQALTYFEKLRLENADYIGTYYHLGKLYERMEESEKAMNTYLTGIEIAKYQGDTHSLSELNAVKMDLEIGE